MSIAALQLLQAFRLSQIAGQAHLARQQEEQKRKEIQSRLTVTSVMNQNGFAIAELFGYHLSREIKQPMAQIAKKNKMIRVNYQNFYHLLTQQWINMGQYHLFIPVIFSILKSYNNSLSLKPFDRYLQICSQSLNPFTANLKQHISPKKMKDLIKEIQSLCEKQDLKGTGFVQKVLIIDIIKKYLSQQHTFTIDERLIVNDQVNYVKLLGEQYLGSGQKIKDYLYSFLIAKMIKVIKKVGVLKKKKKKKEMGKRPERNQKKKQTKNEKLVREYMQQNKRELKEDKKKSETMAKSILYQCILAAMEVNDDKQANDEARQIKKSVYVAQPVIVQHQITASSGEISKIYPGPSATAIFVNSNEGKMVELTSGLLSTGFKINPTRVLNQSSIADYVYFNEVLFIIREDGLLFTWSSQQQSYTQMIQTSYRHVRLKPQELNTNNILFINQGFLLLNCCVTHDGLLLFTLDLQLIGRVQLNSQDFGLSVSLLKQSSLLAKAMDKLNRDVFVNGREQLQGMIRGDYQYKQYLLSRYIFSRNDTISTRRIEDYCSWVLSYRKNNPILLDKQMVQRLRRQAPTEQDYDYLLKYQYINTANIDSLNQFLQASNIVQVGQDQRRHHLATLFEDNILSEIQKKYLTRQQFLKWIEKCTLEESQLRMLWQNVEFDLEGKVRMDLLCRSQQYLRVAALRYQRFMSSQKYKQNELPPILIHYLLPFPALDVLVAAPLFPDPSTINIFSTQGTLLTQLALATYSDGKAKQTPAITYCNQSGYLLFSYGNVITLWNINNVSQKDRRPVRVIKGLQSMEQPIISIRVLYQTNTLATMTRTTLKFWDLEEIVFSGELSQVSFRIKPGFRAVELKKELSPYECKKKVLIRGRGKSFLAFPTKYNNYIVCLLSQSEQDRQSYLKIFYLSKFHVLIKQSKAHQQVPRKIIRLLQDQARRNKYADGVLEIPGFSSSEKEMIETMVKDYRRQLSPQLSAQNIQAQALQLINSLSSLQSMLNQLHKIVNFTLTPELKSITDPKILKQNLLIKLHLSSTQAELQSLFTSQFLELYKDTKTLSIDKQSIRQDLFEVQEKISLNRILCLCGLIFKYSRQYSCDVMELISSKESNLLDEGLVVKLVSGSQMSVNIIKSCVAMINGLLIGAPLQIMQTIILYHIPTCYLYPSLRYYKSIRTHSPSYPCDYFQTHFQNYTIESQKCFSSSQHKYKHILQHLQSQHLLERVKQLADQYRQILNDNLQLIDICMSFNFINERQATYYLLNLPQNSLLSLVGGKHFTSNYKTNLDQIAEKVAFVLAKKKSKVPTPQIQYQWLYTVLKEVEETDDNIYEVFYQRIKGSLTEHSAYSSQLTYLVGLFHKNIAIEYYPMLWKQMLGSRGLALLHHLNCLKQQAATSKIIRAAKLQRILREILPKSSLDLTIRCCYASLNPRSAPKQFPQEKAHKQYVNMHINFEHLIRYLQQSRRQQQNRPIVTSPIHQRFQIQIPSYTLIDRLAQSSSLITYQELIELVSFNVANFTYGQMLQWVEGLPFRMMKDKRGVERKVCGLWELKKILKLDMAMLGQLLLLKYGKVNILSRCLVVDGQVESNQLAQVFFSQGIMKLFIQSCQQLLEFRHFFPLEEIQRILQRDVFRPALDNLASVLCYSLHSQLGNICELIDSESKGEEMATDKFARYLFPVGDIKDHLVKLALTSLLGKYSKKLIVKQSLAKLENAVSSTEQSKQLQMWIKQTQDTRQSFLTVICNIAEPHSVVPNRQIQPQNVKITREHICQILKKNIPWTFSYIPYFTLQGFIDYISSIDSTSKVRVITETCVIKYGLHSFFQSVGPDKFSQFYSKCRAASPTCSKLTALQLSAAYLELSEGGKLCLNKLFKATQGAISPEERINWLVTYKQRLFLEQQIDYSLLPVHNLVLNELQATKELQTISSALKYQEFLIKKYIKSTNRLAFILAHLDKRQRMTELLIENHLEQSHIAILAKFLKNKGQECLNSWRDDQNRSTQPLALQQQAQLLQQICSYLQFMEDHLSLASSFQLNVNFPITEQRWLSSILFKMMSRDIGPEWSCLPSYINLYHYCQNLLTNVIYPKSQYRSLVIDEFNHTMKSISLSLKSIYDAFDLAYQKNMLKYLQYFMGGNPDHHALPNRILSKTKRYLISSFVKYSEGKEIKYPLNFNTFSQLFTQEGSNKQDISVNHGEVFKKLNIWGCGYVNLNEVPSYRGIWGIQSHGSPYISINRFIDLNFPKAKKWRKMNPPPQLYSNRQKITKELLSVQQPLSSNIKLISYDNACRALGANLTEQHRLFIQHQFKCHRNQEMYDLVKLISWLNGYQEQQKSYEVLAKLIEAVEQEGGVYVVIRKYQKQVILAQQVDSLKQQEEFLRAMVEEVGGVQRQEINQMIIRVCKENNIVAHYEIGDEKQENLRWLQQTLTGIVDSYNRQARQWQNYNNSLVRFLNELPQSQYSLLTKLYQTNHTISHHKLFDILTNGATYFTFNHFWIYSSSADESYPFSREEVKEVYQIIDVNSDGNINYQEFCRFWSAVKQIFLEPKDTLATKMAQMKQNIVDCFLAVSVPLFQKGLQGQAGKLTLKQMQQITNIRNKQHLQRLIRIVSPEEIALSNLDVHKLRTLFLKLKSKKSKQTLKQTKNVNYFARIYGSNILDYISSRQSLEFTLQKWLHFSYPTFGRYLCQLFYDDHRWNKPSLSKWIQQYSQTTNESKPANKIKAVVVNRNGEIRQQNYKYFEEIKQIQPLLEQFYKKYKKINNHVPTYALSIAYKLHLQQLLNQYRIFLDQMSHIVYFLENAVEDDRFSLTYVLEEDKEWKYTGEEDDKFRERVLKLAKDQQQPVRFEGQATVDINRNILCSFGRYQDLIMSTYKLTNPQLRAKSGNRFSLLFNRAIYADTLISTSVIDDQLSTPNHLVLYSDFSRYKPLMDIKLLQGGKLASIITMARLVELALYLSKKYQLIGLFVNPCDLCLDTQGEKHFKFTKFFEGIKLDDEGTYLEGINPLQLHLKSQFLIIPPQTHQDIFTETYDSYCLAHILYYLYSGEFIKGSKLTQALEEGVWFGYSQLHYKAKRTLQFLSGQDRNIDVEAEMVFFSLIYECTHYQWHSRPRVHQILNTLLNIMRMGDSLQNIGKSLIIKPSMLQLCLDAIASKDVNYLNQCLSNNKEYEWPIEQIAQIRKNLPNQSKFYSTYNEILRGCLSTLEESGSMEDLNLFCRNMVEYVCQSNKKACILFALQTYNQILSSAILKRYFSYCDQLWKISQFNVEQKLRQLNLQNRIISLPKSSQYYLDISTLMDAKISLYLSEGSDTASPGKGKKHDSTRKMALSFIESSLMSNNVNKIAAVYDSAIIKELYRYLEDKDLVDIVLRIYLLISVSVNVDERAQVHRAVEEGYKVMMVMHNILNLEKPPKKGQTVVDMLTFINNYYNFYGQQCKSQVLNQICSAYLCNLPTLTFLFNTKFQNPQLLYHILTNLTYSEPYYKLLKLPTVHALETCLREIKRNPKYQQLSVKLERLIAIHEFKLCLRELSVETDRIQKGFELLARETKDQFYTRVQRLIDHHIIFFRKNSQQQPKSGAEIKYQNNFFEHFNRFLELTRTIFKEQVQDSYFNGQICSLLQKIMKLHLQTYSLWYSQSETIEFILSVTEKIYEKELYYIENTLTTSLEKVIFDIVLTLLKDQRQKMVSFGFIHLFSRLIKRQHEMIGKYIAKKVQNMQLKNSYSVQAEFRLNTVSILLGEYHQNIHRIFVVIGFGKYLIEEMLQSNMILDLRYYKGNSQIVPFRYCNPLRAEAITMLSLILPMKQSCLKAELVSRILPLMMQEKERLSHLQNNAQGRMKFVETLWLYSNLLDCKDQRLRYQLVNNGSYEILMKLMERYPLLTGFFPKMNDTIKTGTILKSSTIYSRFLGDNK